MHIKNTLFCSEMCDFVKKLHVFARKCKVAIEIQIKIGYNNLIRIFSHRFSAEFVAVGERAALFDRIILKKLKKGEKQ